MPASSFQPQSDLDSQSCDNLEIFETDKVQESEPCRRVLSFVTVK